MKNAYEEKKLHVYFSFVSAMQAEGNDLWRGFS